jgi:hypothetical protein
VVSPIRHAGPASLRGRLPSQWPARNGLLRGGDKRDENAHRYRCAVSESGCSRTTPPIRRISHAARNSPVARDCVVGPRGFELQPDHYTRTLAARIPHIVFQLSSRISSNAAR